MEFQGVVTELYDVQAIPNALRPKAIVTEALPANSGWQPLQVAMLLCKGTMTDIAYAGWLHRYRLPEGFEIFPWSELTTNERHNILARQRRELWFPPELTPFQEVQRIEHLNSLGLRHHSEVVGWMITHRVAEDTIQYTSLFVRKELQGLGRAVPLLAEAIKRQMPSGIERGNMPDSSGYDTYGSLHETKNLAS